MIQQLLNQREGKKLEVVLKAAHRLKLTVTLLLCSRFCFNEANFNATEIRRTLLFYCICSRHADVGPTAQRA